MQLGWKSIGHNTLSYCNIRLLTFLSQKHSVRIPPRSDANVMQSLGRATPQALALGVWRLSHHCRGRSTVLFRVIDRPVLKLIAGTGINRAHAYSHTKVRSARPGHERRNVL